MYEVDDTAQKDEPLLMINVEGGEATDDHTSKDSNKTEPVENNTGNYS